MRKIEELEYDELVWLAWRVKGRPKDKTDQDILREILIQYIKDNYAEEIP